MNRSRINAIIVKKNGGKTMKIKKLISLILAVLMIAAVPVSSFAEEADPENITGAKVYIDTDKLVGKTKDEFVQLLSTDTPGIEIDKENILITKMNGNFSETDKYEYSVNYYAQIHLYPQEGYKLSESMTELRDAVTVEGRRILVPYDENSKAPIVSVHYATPVYDEHITVSFSFRATGPVNVVETIDITFDNEIDGKTPADFKDFVSVNTEGVKMGSEKFWATDGYPEWPSSRNAEIYEAGKTYYSAIYIYPEEGYAFPCSAAFTVNGQKTYEGDSVYVLKTEYETVTDTTKESCKYVKILLEYQVAESVKELTFFEKIGQAISNFFLAIATFFTETVFQPIADLFMKIA